MSIFKQRNHALVNLRLYERLAARTGERRYEALARAFRAKLRSLERSIIVMGLGGQK